MGLVPLLSGEFLWPSGREFLFRLPVIRRRFRELASLPPSLNKRVGSSPRGLRWVVVDGKALQVLRQDEVRGKIITRPHVSPAVNQVDPQLHLKSPLANPPPPLQVARNNTGKEGAGIANASLFLALGMALFGFFAPLLALNATGAIAPSTKMPILAQRAWRADVLVGPRPYDERRPLETTPALATASRDRASAPSGRCACRLLASRRIPYTAAFCRSGQP